MTPCLTSGSSTTSRSGARRSPKHIACCALGGRFYAEEVLRAFILNPVTKVLLEQPLTDRFDHDEFRASLVDGGFRIVASRHAFNNLGWFVAETPELQ